MSHRNEAARARHRKDLKQRFSLTSIPLVEWEPPTLRLENHFGWKIQQKCRIGEGEFPQYLMACFRCDKPEIRFGENEKVTYVLYVQNGGEEDTKSLQMQTEPTKEEVEEEPPVKLGTEPPPPIQAKDDLSEKPSKPSKKKKRLISDFYYIPVRERSRSPDGTGNARSADSNQSAGDMNIPDDEAKDLNLDKVGRKPPKSQSGRSKPKRWQLRAGAECSYDRPADGSEQEDQGSDEESSESDPEEYDVLQNNNLKSFDCVSCCIQTPKEVLLESRAKLNRYLFVPTERYERRYSRSDPMDRPGTDPRLF